MADDGGGIFDGLASGLAGFGLGVADGPANLAGDAFGNVFESSDAGGVADFASVGTGVADLGASLVAPFNYDAFANQFTATSTGGASVIADDFANGVKQIGQGFGYYPAIDLSSVYYDQNQKGPIDIAGAGQSAKVAPSSGNGIWGSIPKINFPFNQPKYQQSTDYSGLLLIGGAVVIIALLASGGGKKK